MSHHDPKVDEYLDIESNSVSQSKKELAADQLRLGIAYFKAYHIEDNCSTAFKWIKLSAEQGNMEAQFRLAELYSLGQGISQSHKDAYKWYTKAAIQGYKKASIRIHNFYQEDVKMHCRGRLDSKEELRVKVSYDDHASYYDSFNGDLGGDEDDRYYEKMPEYHYRELNEQRLDDHKLVLNHAINYYTVEYEKYKSSNKEDVEIQQNLGFLYQHGYGVKKYEKWAIDYYTKAAEHGHVDSQYQLGCLYQKNTRIKFNYKKAFHWYKLAADGGNIAAQNALAFLYEKGLGTDIDYQQALYWYTKSAESGHSRAQLTLGKWYRKGDYVDRNYETAIKWYTLAAQQGNSVAQNCLAQLYQTRKVSSLHHEEYVSEYCKEGFMKGRLCSKLQMDILGIHDQEIVEKIKTLAKHSLIGDGNAMYQIGLNYYGGNDFDEDKHVGFKWIKLAAEAGYTKAVFKVTRMYEEGDTVLQDFHKTAIWTKKGIKQRNDIAQCNLGILYDEGRGVRNDPFEASKWFILSASQGNREAQYQLGRLKQRGRGMRRNKEEALALFSLLAKQGDINGCYKVGINYFNKYDKNIDSTGYKLLEYSARHGNEYAQYRLWYAHSNNHYTKASFYFDMLLHSKSTTVISRMLHSIESVNSYGDNIRYFNLLERASFLEISTAKNILQTPFNDHIEVNRNYLLATFTLVSVISLSSMEYNIGCIYEYQAINESSNNKRLDNYAKAIHWYYISAEKGDSRAQVQLGIICEEGKGVTVNFTEAINYYNSAYEKRNMDAMYRLACMYLDGRGISQCLETAYKLYTRASDMGHIEARKVLMLPYNILDKWSPEYKYYQHQAVEINLNNQMKMLELMAKSGLVAIQYQLGNFYENKDDSKAMVWFALATQGGVTDACYKLGVLYEEGRGTEQDYMKAISYYEKAISSEHENAMYRLAQMHLYGKGIDTNYTKAYKLYSEAAELGHISSCKILGANLPIDEDLSSVDSDSENSRCSFDPNSNKFKRYLLMFQHVAEEGNAEIQYKLGVIYEDILEKPNYEEAAKWFSMATESSHREATYRLGLLYETGSGVIQDYQKAIDLYNQARKLGSRDALYRLGNVYHHGTATGLNLEKAVQHYTESANNGHLKSQHMLGKLYEQGILVKKDILKALRWLTTAYLEGYEPVKIDLYAMYNDLPYEDYFFTRLNSILLSVSKRFLSLPFKTYENIYGSEYKKIHGYMVYQLGIQYLYGNSVPQDYEKALEYFNLSDDRFDYTQAWIITNLIYNGDTDLFFKMLNVYDIYFDILKPYQQYDLAMIYYDGISTTLKHKTVSLESLNNTDNSANLGDLNNKQEIILTRDYRKARYYFEKVTGNWNENRNAQEKLAEIYIYGHGVEKNIDKAIEYYTRAFAEKHYTFKIAQIYHFNVDFCDHSKAVEWYKRAGKCKKSSALNILGILYKVGHFVNRNYKTALQYFIEVSKCDDYDSRFAFYNLGLMYYHGEGVKQNYTEALAYFKMASENDHEKAQIYLVKMYLDGCGTEKNIPEAKKWHSKVSKASSTNENIGVANVRGYSEYPEAIEWFKKVEENYPVTSLRDIEAIITNTKGVTGIHKEPRKTVLQSIKSSKGESSYSLGNMYLNGQGVQKDYREAYTYFMEAAEKDSNEAKVALAEIYKKGYGVPKNIEKVIEWYIKASKDEPNRYAFNIAYLYGTDLNFCDYAKAIEWYLKVEGDDRAFALMNIGNFYFNGEGVDKDYKQALHCYKESANIGNELASYYAGIAYYYGQGVDRNYREAYSFFKTAADKNHLDAQLMIAEMYTTGYGVPRDMEKAIEWYTKASKDEPNRYAFDIVYLYSADIKIYDQTGAIERCKKIERGKRAGALRNIGNLYFHGNGVPQDYERASQYREEAEKLVNEHVPYNLALMHYNSKSAAQDYKQASQYYEKSEDLGNKYTSYNLGVMYYNGQDVAQNLKKAHGFFLTAANKNHHIAQLKLAEMYMNGRGVDRDIEKVIEWCTKASNGDPKRYAFEIAYLYGTDKNFYDPLKAIEWYKKVEGNNKAAALNSIGVFYFNGNGVNKDYEQAIRYYKQSAELGCEYASYNLGAMYYHAIGVDQDYNDAHNFFKTAADKNHLDAQLMLAVMYTEGYGVPRDIEKAIEWYTKASKDEPNRYAFDIAYLYGTDQDFRSSEKAIEWYKKVEGDKRAGALSNIGNLYYYGNGVAQDYERASQYYEESEKLGCEYASYNLGLLYYSGRGVGRNFKEAHDLFEAAANKNHQNSQLMLAKMYTEGYGVPKDIEKVIAWYTKASKDESNRYAFEIAHLYGTEKDFYDPLKAIEWFKKVEGDKKSAALLNIGILYYRGHGIDNDLKQAFHYFKESAKLGRVDALFALGKMYYYGEGVDQNYKEAYDCFKTASDKNFVLSQEQLVIMYLHGQGVAKNISQAIEWSTKAANNGSDYATKTLGELHHFSVEVQDFTKAFEWYQKAQGGDSSFALRGIGLLFEYGDGVDQEYSKSVEYYQQSVDLENKGGYYNLALMYYHGKGVEKDHRKCFHLLYECIKKEPISGNTHVFVRIKNNPETSTNRENRIYSLENEITLYGEIFYQLGIMHKNGQGTDRNDEKAKKCFSKAIEYGNEQAKDQIYY